MTEKKKKPITGDNFDLAHGKLLQLMEESGVDVARLDTPNLKRYLKKAWIESRKEDGFYLGDHVVAKLFAYGRDYEQEHVCVFSFYPRGRERNQTLTMAFNEAINAVL